MTTRLQMVQHLLQRCGHVVAEFPSLIQQQKTWQPEEIKTHATVTNVLARGVREMARLRSSIRNLAVVRTDVEMQALLGPEKQAHCVDLPTLCDFHCAETH